MEQQNHAALPVLQHQEIQARLEECAHCKGAGTCRNGEKESSCEVCARRNMSWSCVISFSKLRYGLVCSVCEGTGCIEPKTERLHKRLEPALSIVLVYFSFTLITFAAFCENKHFSEILAFSSTIIASVTGYYFGGKKK